VSRGGDHISAGQHLEEAERRLEPLERQINTLQEQLEEAQQKAEQDESARREVEGAREAQLRNLEEATRAAQAEAKALQAELQAYRDREAVSAATAARVREEATRQQNALAAERDRLRDEVSAVRSELEAQTLDAAERLARLAEQRDLVQAEGEQLRDEALRLRTELDARSAEAQQREPSGHRFEALQIERDHLQEERDRLQSEVQALRAEVQALRAELDGRAADAGRLESLSAELEAVRADHGRLDAERQQAVSDRAQSLSRLGELEQSLAAAIAAHEEGRGSWEAERRALLEWGEVERRNLLDEAEKRGRHERDADRCRDEAIRTALRQETERLRSEMKAAVVARDEAWRQTAELGAECDQLRAESAQQSTAQQAEHDRLTTALDLARREAQAAAHRSSALDEQVHTFRDEFNRLRQEGDVLMEEQDRILEAQRQELAAERKGREEHESARRQAEKQRDVLHAQSEQLRAEHHELRLQFDALTTESVRRAAQHETAKTACEEAKRQVQTERDRLGQELAEARTHLTETSQQGEQLAAQVCELQTTLERLGQEREAQERDRATERDALRQEQEAKRLQSAELDAARNRAEESRRTFRQEAEQLRTALEAERRLADELRTERNGLLKEHEAESAVRQSAERDRQAERDRLTAALDVARQEVQTATRRGDALEEQLRTLRDQGNHPGEGQDAESQAREDQRVLLDLRRELEAARAERDAERDRATSGEAARTDLQRRLADALREHRAAVARAEKLEAEVQAVRSQRPRRTDGHGRPSPSAGEALAAPPHLSQDPEQPAEELARQLRLAQEANERLRSFLAVFGTHSEAIGKDVDNL
jgi:chromosome segregation ATPase